MGCDIHSAVEVFDGTKWNWAKDIVFPLYDERTTNQPFDWRYYNMYCFLADVYCRDSSILVHLSSYRGLPKDLSKELSQDPWNEELWLGEFGFGWLTLDELLNFDYEQSTGNMNINFSTYKEMLGDSFFRDIKIMQALHEDPTKIRIVFGFDN